MGNAWGREQQPGLAAKKILDAAEKAFIELGISRAGMASIAEFAGCSRGTLYRYFKSRHELHLAYVNRAALRIVEHVRVEMAGIRDPRERLVQCILLSVREVRNNPGTAAWFESGASDMAAGMSRSSELVDTLTTAFVSKLLGAPGRSRESQLRARWFVRVIISLLVIPEESEAAERALVERFVVPVLLPEKGD
jgi:AcrR family transcriptional regulator